MPKLDIPLADIERCMHVLSSQELEWMAVHTRPLAHRKLAKQVLQARDANPHLDLPFR